MITDILNHHKVKQLSERILNTVHEVSSFVELLSLSEIKKKPRIYLTGLTRLFDRNSRCLSEPYNRFFV